MVYAVFMIDLEKFKERILYIGFILNFEVTFQPPGTMKLITPQILERRE